MDEISDLITAARRYCMDQAGCWHRRYAEMDADPISERALATYPRYHVLEAILEGIERYVPEDFRMLAEARERLAFIGQTAENMFTMPPNATISVQAMQAERDKFIRYVREVSVDLLPTIEPLPYRRTLTEGEPYDLLRS